MPEKKMDVRDFLLKVRSEGLTYALLHYFGSIDDRELTSDELSEIEISRLVENWEVAHQVLHDLDSRITRLMNKLDPGEPWY